MVHLWAWFSRGEQLPESTVSQSHSKVTLETLQVSRAFLFPSIGGQWRRARPLCCVWRAGESPPLLAPCSDYRDILDGARLANACQRLFENRCILNSLKISINHFSGAPTAGEIDQRPHGGQLYRPRWDSPWELVSAGVAGCRGLSSPGWPHSPRGGGPATGREGAPSMPLVVMMVPLVPTHAPGQRPL